MTLLFRLRPEIPATFLPFFTSKSAACVIPPCAGVFEPEEDPWRPSSPFAKSPHALILDVYSIFPLVCILKRIGRRPFHQGIPPGGYRLPRPTKFRRNSWFVFFLIFAAVPYRRWFANAVSPFFFSVHNKVARAGALAANFPRLGARSP